MTNKNKIPLVGKEYLPYFLMVGAMFPLWGFVNDVTNPLVKVFKDIFLISNAESGLVQFAFYFGYGVMAIPAALFMRVYSYKSGILFGMFLYAIGASLFIPASLNVSFYFFLTALFVATSGLAFLEVTCNPYVLSMGPRETATRRLNLVQAFNPLGSLAGMFTATVFLQNLEVEKFRAHERASHPEYVNLLPSEVDGKVSQALADLSVSKPDMFTNIQLADLALIREPYLAIALLVIVLLVVFTFVNFPKTNSSPEKLTANEVFSTLKRLISNRKYVQGIVAHFFYNGAQIMCWTFIVHYGVMIVGLSAAEAQGYNMIAMLMFVTGRFFSTYLLGMIRPSRLLGVFAIAAASLVTLTILLEGILGLYCLVGVSFFMSLMYPTIFGVTLKQVDEHDTKLASAGLVMAIMGGAILPVVQGSLIDNLPMIAGIPSIKLSFLLPLFAFIVIGIFASRMRLKSST